MKKANLKKTKITTRSRGKVRPAAIKPKETRTATKEAVLQPAFGLHNLRVPKGARRKKKLLGRGTSSGHGKTSSRGSKGQTSRAGRHFYLGFEGGQSPLIRRMPKRGFVNTFRKEYQIVNLGDLERLKAGEITPEILEEKGLIKDKAKLVKILGDGQLKSAIKVQAHAFSRRAAQELKNAGGNAEVISLK
jgi:large subunit ribosomal protein L15